MSRVQKLIDLYGDEFSIAIGFDKALIGYDELSDRAIYSAKKCITILMKEERMSYEDAHDYYNNNVKTKKDHNSPIFCNDLDI